MTTRVVLAIDAGTTGVRTVAIDEHGTPGAYSYREFPQYFPQPGWVEHDPTEIWDATLATLTEVVAAVRENGDEIAAIGITNQRETVVVWDRRTGLPRHRALVWQDRRTAAYCDELRTNGVEPAVRAATGLVLDPYFSGTKLRWLLTDGGVVAGPDLAFGTVDSWLVWRLTNGAVHATDASNASRTMLFDIGSLRWSDELCELLDVPSTCLPEVRPSSGDFGTTHPECAAGLQVPIGGIAGDQQAALFGQACFDGGMAKNTYGTGSFVLVNLGAELPAPTEGLLTTVAWTIGDTTTYAMEGSVFITGAAIQWLRDGLHIIESSADASAIAAATPTTDGVYLVPAFAGLGSPYWDAYARGTIVGITRGSTREHFVRAAVEAMAFQTRDVVDAITAASGTPLRELRVDGGASANDAMLAFQADLLGVTVRRPQVLETTAQGAAYLAGVATGVWSSPADAAASWQEDAEFAPATDRTALAKQYEGWQRAVERSRRWATD
ncbi:MAG: glycerol kinase GlpK [Acidimicrobiia bacterium]